MKCFAISLDAILMRFFLNKMVSLYDTHSRNFNKFVKFAKFVKMATVQRVNELLVLLYWP
jgi:succinate dehydrogenase flavin-adding protein (antitoxin of CptAB toxin-antitoxin module)